MLQYSTKEMLKMQNSRVSYLTGENDEYMEEEERIIALSGKFLEQCESSKKTRKGLINN